MAYHQKRIHKAERRNLLEVSGTCKCAAKNYEVAGQQMKPPIPSPTDTTPEPINSRPALGGASPAAKALVLLAIIVFCTMWFIDRYYRPVIVLTGVYSPP